MGNVNSDKVSGNSSGHRSASTNGGYVSGNINEDVDEDAEESDTDPSEAESPWYTDNSGLDFNYPPRDAFDALWMDEMFGKLDANAREFDDTLLRVKSALSDRLARATLLELEVGEAMSEYEEMLGEVGVDVAHGLLKSPRCIAVPQLGDRGSVEVLPTPRTAVGEDGLKESVPRPSESYVFAAGL